jgi:hypothetical protein
VIELKINNKITIIISMVFEIVYMHILLGASNEWIISPSLYPEVSGTVLVIAEQYHINK